MKYIISILTILILTSCEANSDSNNEPNKSGIVYEGEKYNLYLDKIISDLDHEGADSLGYAYGLRAGLNMLRDSMNIDLKYFISGLIQGINYDTTKFLLTKTELNNILGKYQQQKIREQSQKARKERRIIDSLAGYFFDNEERILNETVAKGNWEKDIKGFWKIEEVEGKGDLVPVDMTLGHTVKMWLPEDSTLVYELGTKAEPLHLFMEQTLPAIRKIWDDGIHIGDKYHLLLPSELAFGGRGLDGAIPRHAPLIVELDVISSSAKRPKDRTNYNPQQNGPGGMMPQGMQAPQMPQGRPRR